MRKLLVLAALLILAAITGIFLAGIILYIRNCLSLRVNPVYYGNRIDYWVDQAIWSSDPTVRQDTVRILGEVCQRENADVRLHLYYDILNSKQNGQRPAALPSEFVAFLANQFRKEDRNAAVVGGAFALCPPAETVPVLTDLLREEQVPYKRKMLIDALGKFGAMAKPAIPEWHGL
jgi:hypothetical protein